MSRDVARAVSPHAAVAIAWRRVMGRRALVEDRVFGPDAEEGLHRLRLVHHLEAVLGRALRVDPFRNAHRPSDFVAVLQAPGKPLPRPPDLILLPGIGGDDNHLLTFRAGLPPSIVVAVVLYPEWAETGGPGRDFEALVDDAVAQILALAPAGDLRLAGFSIGGHVGHAACLRLQARGRRVETFAIIDSPRVPGFAPGGRGWSGRLGGFLSMARQGRTMESLCSFTVKLIRRRRPDLIAQVISRRLYLPFDFGFFLRRAMIMDIHVRRLSPWLEALNAAPVPIDVSTVLFRSEEHPPEVPEDLGWRPLCPNLKVVQLRGSHTGIFSPANIGSFRDVFLSEMGFL